MGTFTSYADAPVPDSDGREADAPERARREKLGGVGPLGRGGRARAFSREAALIDLVQQRLVADAEEAGRLGAVPVHALEDVADGVALRRARGLARDRLVRGRRRAP